MGSFDGNLQENSIVLMIIAGILIMLALALAFVLFANYSQRKILAGELLHQQELLHSTILTQEDERKRIARELHDEIGSKLNVILLNMHHFRKQVVTKPEHEEIATDIKTLITTTIDTTRRISHDLLPPVLENFGLVEAIKELCDSYHKVDGLLLEFELMTAKSDIGDSLIELSLFRVIQELISNSIRHGKSTEMRIRLWLVSHKTTLHYQDNGFGFDMSKIASAKGLGMKNIESRLNMIGATYDFESYPDKGVLFQAEVKM